MIDASDCGLRSLIVEEICLKFNAVVRRPVIVETILEHKFTRLSIKVKLRNIQNSSLYLRLVVNW